MRVDNSSVRICVTQICNQARALPANSFKQLSDGQYCPVLATCIAAFLCHQHLLHITVNAVAMQSDTVILETPGAQETA